MEHNRLVGAYSLRDFYKICRICTSFHDALAVKVLLDLLKGLWSYGGFNLTGSGYPQIFSASYGETMRQTPERYAKFGGDRISPAVGAAKNVVFFVLSVTLLNVRVCAPDFTTKTLKYRNEFDAFG